MKKLILLLLILCLPTFAQVSGNALQFDGVDDFIRSSLTTSLGQDYTVELWVKSNSLTGYPFHRGNSGECRYEPSVHFNDSASGEINAYVYGCGGSGLFATDTLLADNWYHVAIVRDINTQYLYINGVLEKTGNRSNYSGDNFKLFVAATGSHELGSSFLNGTVDEVRVWDTTRTAMQIQATMNDTLSSIYYSTTDSGLVCYWRLDLLEDLGIESDGADDVRDLSVNGNHGDVEGYPALISTTPGLDFSIGLTVIDNCSHSNNLMFGTAYNATDGYDADYDQYAPPPPPVGAFGSWFTAGSEYLTQDFRATNEDTVITWDVHYQRATNCDTIKLYWNPSSLPTNVASIRLVDFITGGDLINVNMRSDSSYSDGSSLDHLQIVYSFSRSFDDSLMAGWNMIGLPWNIVDPYYLSVYPNAVTNTLYGFNGSYYSEDTLEFGNGYWLRFPTAHTQTIVGTPVGYLTIAILEGWNMISGPSCDIVVSDIYDPLDVIVPGTIYGFNGSYALVSDTLRQGKGYWIRASSSGGAIAMSCGDHFPKPSQFTSVPLVAFDQCSQIEITDTEDFTQTLYFNPPDDKEIDPVSYTMPPLPPLGCFDARFEGDYRLIESDNGKIKIQSTSFPLAVTFKNITKSPSENVSYVLQEKIGTKVIAEYTVSEGNTIYLRNANITSLYFSTENNVPIFFTVEQNYPNPFNPTTEIKYSIPEYLKVDIIIYNDLGQKVKTLISQFKEAGTHYIEWKGTNDANTKVASGVYI